MPQFTVRPTPEEYQDVDVSFIQLQGRAIMIKWVLYHVDKGDRTVGGPQISSTLLIEGKKPCLYLA